ncbi:MAG: hypothetical protein NC311_07720 [Muribaculaceae bacterium]|nr:hypothetical protein [Muribaculaceae bacterium]
MKFSPKLKTFCDSYDLRPQEVAVAILHANGLNWSEAFAIVFQTLDDEATTNNNRAMSLLKNRPKIATLDAKLTLELKKNREALELFDRFNAKKAASSKDPDGWDENLSPSKNVEKIFKGEIGGLRGKEKIDAGLKYAKMLGFDVEESDTIHYYLPLTCYQCGLYIQNSKDKEQK